ncbi:acetamidase/formamidase family protein [Amnibacterium sp.]|uniref:acetamidase/formamidase family protein n=1 Tax=Amnibacterium sp. TaxID=1872496 RepID=UPI00263986D9|nr:acetamidase/formamidase family protein [Amnibacterium sp.]MCU1472492.1 acetamidase [Amnibacterium sp.]
MRFDFSDWTALQPGSDASTYLAATPETVLWGRLPCAADRAVMTVASGTVVTVDTVSHEGVLPEQGQDPVAYFARHGVPRELVLDDAVAVASRMHHDPADGPHVVTGPIGVEGARPGDLLRIDVVELEPRVPYGVISNRHGRGALPGEYPATPETVSVFAAVQDDGDGAFGVLPRSADSEAVVRFPLAPFLGLIGVAVAGEERAHSVPPGAHGGNLDIRLLVPGTTLFLPVQVPDALVYVGDPHFAQGDGEVALTAMEASLRVRLGFDVIAREDAVAAFGDLAGPMAETSDFLVPTGMDEDLDVAVQNCVRAAIALLQARFGMDPRHAYAYLSAATDFDISQVVDQVLGVHARIRKADFA